MVTSQSFLYDVMLILYIFHSLNRLQSHLGGTELFSSRSWMIMLLIGRRDTTPVWTERRCWGSATWPLSQQKWLSPVLPQQEQTCFSCYTTEPGLHAQYKGSRAVQALYKVHFWPPFQPQYWHCSQEAVTLHSELVSALGKETKAEVNAAENLP